MATCRCDDEPRLAEVPAIRVQAQAVVSARSLDVDRQLALDPHLAVDVGSRGLRQRRDRDCPVTLSAAFFDQTP